MASIFISEYTIAGSPGVGGYLVPVATEPAVVEQVITIGGSSTQSAAFSPNTTFIRVHTGAICSILIGANPTASATVNKRLAANQTEYFVVAPGQKLAVISNT